MNILITILLVLSIVLAIITPLWGGDNGAYVAAMLTIAAIGVRGKA